jgi:hypothetical protein
MLDNLIGGYLLEGYSGGHIDISYDPEYCCLCVTLRRGDRPEKCCLVSLELLMRTRYPKVILEEIIREELLADCSGSTFGLTCTFDPSIGFVVCDGCGNHVHAVIEDRVQVYPVYTSKKRPEYQLCQSCYERAEQAGRARLEKEE